jgi:hypothetical protein
MAKKPDLRHVGLERAHRRRAEIRVEVAHDQDLVRRVQRTGQRLENWHDAIALVGDGHDDRELRHQMERGRAARRGRHGYKGQVDWQGSIHRRQGRSTASSSPFTVRSSRRSALDSPPNPCRTLPQRGRGSRHATVPGRATAANGTERPPADWMAVGCACVPCGGAVAAIRLAILAVNPRPQDPNLIVTGQTLVLPQRPHESEPRPASALAGDSGDAAERAGSRVRIRVGGEQHP